MLSLNRFFSGGTSSAHASGKNQTNSPIVGQGFLDLVLELDRFSREVDQPSMNDSEKSDEKARETSSGGPRWTEESSGSALEQATQVGIFNVAALDSLALRNPFLLASAYGSRPAPKEEKSPANDVAGTDAKHIAKDGEVATKTVGKAIADNNLSAAKTANSAIISQLEPPAEAQQASPPVVEETSGGPHGGQAISPKAVDQPLRPAAELNAPLAASVREAGPRLWVHTGVDHQESLPHSTVSSEFQASTNDSFDVGQGIDADLRLHPNTSPASIPSESSAAVEPIEPRETPFVPRPEVASAESRTARWEPLGPWNPGEAAVVSTNRQASSEGGSEQNFDDRPKNRESGERADNSKSAAVARQESLDFQSTAASLFPGPLAAQSAFSPAEAVSIQGQRTATGGQFTRRGSADSSQEGVQESTESYAAGSAGIVTADSASQSLQTSVNATSTAALKITIDQVAELIAEGAVDDSALSFQITSEELGGIEIRVDRSERGLIIRLLTENPMASELLRAEQDRLRDAIGSRGIELESVEILPAGTEDGTEDGPGSRNAGEQESQWRPPSANEAPLSERTTRKPAAGVSSIAVSSSGVDLLV